MTNPVSGAPGGPGHSAGGHQAWDPGARARHHMGSPDKGPRPASLPMVNNK